MRFMLMVKKHDQKHIYNGQTNNHFKEGQI
jgi:hypothetical protein